MTIKALYPTSEPTLNLDFANTKRLDPRITFSRASAGTYFDENGTLRSAATNAARFDHNPATGESLGLLVEEARTNSFLYSDITQSPYSSNLPLSFVGWNPALFLQVPSLAPDGTINITLHGAVNNNGGGLRQRVTGLVAGATYTVSWYARTVTAAELTLFTNFHGLTTGLIVGATNQPYYAGVSTSCGVTNHLGTGASGGANFNSVLTSSWQRFSGTAVADNAGSIGIIIANGSSPAPEGSVTAIWGAQLELGSFATSYIPSAVTFTGRTSTATFYNASGVVQTAASGVARSDAYFPDSNGVMRSAGLLLEAAATNLVTYSEQINDASWTKSNATVTADAIAAPDGTTTAELVYPTTTGSLRYVYKSASIASGITTMSFFAKSAGMTRCYLVGATTSIAGWFDLSAGTVGTVTSGCTAFIERLSNGWHRCSLSQPISATPYASIGPCDADNSFVATTSATNGIYVWGGQLETSSFPTSYIPTTGSTVTRSADTSTSATVTRSADVAQMTGTNFSGWYNQNEGTTLAKTKNLKGSASPHVITFTNTASDEIALYGNTLTPYAQAYGIIVAIGPQWNMTKSSTDPSSSAFAYKANDISFVVSGGSASLDTSALIPVVDRFVFCADVNGTGRTSGHVSRLTYWPVRLPDATLQALTV